MIPRPDDAGPSDAVPTPEVLVAGAGPSGLMLAYELALAGIDTVVLDRHSEPSADPRPSGPCRRVARMVDHRGLHALPQAEFVPTLAERATALGVEIRRGHELVDLEQDDAGVTVDVTGPEGPYRLRADYVVGADGARSAIRARAAIGFPDSARASAAARPAVDETRIADRFRDGRVFLIGDAAHVCGATGDGPGLNLGLADAMNLGWKLAAAVLGDAGPDLLDSYERERRPAAERIAADAQAQADLIAGTDVRYPMGDEQTGELVGRLAPEMTLTTPGGPVTLAELTTRALPLLVDLTEQGTLAAAIAPWHEEVDVIRARPETAASTTALFLRPDCFVAWSTTSSQPSPDERDALRTAAERWLGTGRE